MTTFEDVVTNGRGWVWGGGPLTPESDWSCLTLVLSPSFTGFCVNPVWQAGISAFSPAGLYHWNRQLESILNPMNGSRQWVYWLTDVTLRVNNVMWLKIHLDRSLLYVYKWLHYGPILEISLIASWYIALFRSLSFQQPLIQTKQPMRESLTRDPPLFEHVIS